MNIYKDVFSYNKNDLKNINTEEIIRKFNVVWDKRIKLVMTLTKKSNKTATLNLLNNKRHEEYIKLLIDIGIVVPFPAELMKSMENVIVDDKNLAQHFNDYTTRGRCKTMSVALSTLFEEGFIIKNATLHTPLIEFYHQWLEHDGKVYDTTKQRVFPINYYYDIYKRENIHELTIEEIEKIKHDPYYKITSKNDKKR